MATFRQLTVEECISIDLVELKRQDALCDGKTIRLPRAFCRGADKVAEIVIEVDLSNDGCGRCLRISGTAYGQRINQQVALVAVPMRFGGHKWFITCPRTGGRCRRLILPPGAGTFLSVRGWSVPYISQVVDIFDRTHRAMRKIEARLARLSKYARSYTRRRLRQRLRERDLLLEQLVAARMERFNLGGD